MLLFAFGGAEKRLAGTKSGWVIRSLSCVYVQNRVSVDRMALWTLLLKIRAVAKKVITVPNGPTNRRKEDDRVAALSLALDNPVDPLLWLSHS
jgi:hypothetical protein